MNKLWIHVSISKSDATKTSVLPVVPKLIWLIALFSKKKKKIDKVPASD